jgi:hypothetical protein
MRWINFGGASPEPKRLELYEGGHIAPLEIAIPAITKWFDQTMGPVAQ